MKMLVIFNHIMMLIALETNYGWINSLQDASSFIGLQLKDNNDDNNNDVNKSQIKIYYHHIVKNIS